VSVIYLENTSETMEKRKEIRGIDEEGTDKS
jgi:hypothetical protein